MDLPLSILDLVPVAAEAGDDVLPGSQHALRNSLALAQLADGLGFTRYWFAEHHNMQTIASTTPEIMIALAAERTTRIRVGSGGVMLPNHASLKVAETFKMLEALHPGRIDLGIGRAPGTDQATALALRGSRDAWGAEQFPDQLLDLLEYGGRADPRRTTESTPAQTNVAAVPKDVRLPPIWLLGSSDYSAHLAALLGLGFGFAAHFSEFPPEAPMQAYRNEFAAHGHSASPHAVLTLSVICAPSVEEAERLVSSLYVAFARLRTGQTSLLLPPEQALLYNFSPAERAVVDKMRDRHIVGTSDTVRRRIIELAQRTQADEVMISTFVPSLRARMRSYELLADAFHLSSKQQPPRSDSQAAAT